MLIEVARRKVTELNPCVTKPYIYIYIYISAGCSTCSGNMASNAGPPPTTAGHPGLSTEGVFYHLLVCVFSSATNPRTSCSREYI